MKEEEIIANVLFNVEREARLISRQFPPGDNVVLRGILMALSSLRPLDSKVTLLGGQCKVMDRNLELSHRVDHSQLRDRFMFRLDELATENISQNEFLNAKEEFYILSFLVEESPAALVDVSSFIYNVYTKFATDSIVAKNNLLQVRKEISVLRPY